MDTSMGSEFLEYLGQSRREAAGISATMFDGLRDAQNRAISAGAPPTRLPALSPIFLLERLSRKNRPRLSEGWRRYLVDYAVALTTLQRAERLLWALDNALVADVAELLYKGKSSVIIPIVAAELANGPRLTRVIVPKSQSRQMMHTPTCALGGPWVYLFEKGSRDVIDESDDVFSTKSELTYTIGQKQAADFSRLRWRLIQSILGLAAEIIPKLSQQYPDKSITSRRPRSSAHHSGPPLANDILHHVARSKPKIRVILDASAQIVELGNDQAARCWVELVPDEDIRATIFFNAAKDLCVVERDGTTEPFLTSSYATNMAACIVFLDQTRGTDLRLPSHYRAAVTLRPGLTKDRLVQAVLTLAPNQMTRKGEQNLTNIPHIARFH
ncbi:hypothetical protein B0T26DRAFT_675213 [Lasiosphaeria miniovina]|uniref:DUF3638 domain-containing protein n=1 Tax=Lasiosphaeria miniovina TaxID=1954250 RepID=A0AA40AJB9_9PEZI|nr:uncharacterized protein B0T26DRAFT_675213 [Lasiosphaeria miniovina]KAK0716790.1 hypothetical protein B0T26DRAFT_675213 [Lasiosphaeria miniovina]